MPQPGPCSSTGPLLWSPADKRGAVVGTETLLLTRGGTRPTDTAALVAGSPPHSPSLTLRSAPGVSLSKTPLTGQRPGVNHSSVTETQASKYSLFLFGNMLVLSQFPLGLI